MRIEWCERPRCWKLLTYHPLACLVEFGLGVDVEAIAAHMRQHGFDTNESIILYRETPQSAVSILDGRHRHAAAIVAGQDPSFQMFIGTKAEAVAFITKKLLRQHLDEDQRAMLAVKLRNLLPDVSADPPFGGSAPKQGSLFSRPTQAEAAEMLNVSERRVERAEKVESKGTDALKQAMADQTVSISDAAKVADEPPEVQDAAVADVRAGKATTASQAAQQHRQPPRSPDSIPPMPTGGRIAKVSWEELERIARDVRKVPVKIAAAFEREDQSDEYREFHRLADEAEKLLKDWRKLIPKRAR